MNRAVVKVMRRLLWWLEARSVHESDCAGLPPRRLPAPMRLCSVWIVWYLQQVINYLIIILQERLIHGWRIKKIHKMVEYVICELYGWSWKCWQVRWLEVHVKCALWPSLQSVFYHPPYSLLFLLLPSTSPSCTSSITHRYISCLSMCISCHFIQT